MIECVFIYRTYHIVSQGGLQFYLSEIGRQLVEAPLAAAKPPRGADKPYFSVQDLSWEVLLFFLMYPWKKPWGSFGLGKAVTHRNVFALGQTLFTHG